MDLMPYCSASSRRWRVLSATFFMNSRSCRALRTGAELGSAVPQRGRLEEAEQEQEVGEEARAAVRRVPCVAGSDPANPASSRPGSEQGRQVPDVGDAQRQFGGEGAGLEEAGKVPAEEGAVPRRGCGERGDVARRVPSEYRDVDQLLGLAAEEELEQCEDPPHQEHDGEVLPHPRLSGMSG